MGPKEKAKLMKNLNNWLYDERTRNEDFLKDLYNIRKATKDLRVENPNLHGSLGKLTIMIEKLIRKSGISYPDGKKASE